MAKLLKLAAEQAKTQPAAKATPAKKATAKKTAAKQGRSAEAQGRGTGGMTGSN